MNNTHASCLAQLASHNAKQRGMLGGFTLGLLSAAALVGAWRGSFEGATGQDFSPISLRSSMSSREHNGNTHSVILVPEQVSTIQGAIDQASDGAIIFVAPGSYRESIRVQGKNISLQSIGRLESATILGDGGEGPIARVEDSTFMMDGIRLRDEKGGFSLGLSMNRSEATIVNCEFTNNKGGVALINSRAQFDRCRIEDNHSTSEGGGLWCWQSDVRLGDSAVEGNTTETCGGGVYARGGSMQMVQVSIKNNRVRSGAWGGGVYSDQANISLSDCVLTGNFSNDSGAAIYVLDAGARIRSSTFTSNRSSGASTVVGANARFDIQDSVMETAEETAMETAPEREALLAMAGAAAHGSSALDMAGR